VTDLGIIKRIAGIEGIKLSSDGVIHNINLTDLEICKRLAEIEGLDYFKNMCDKNAILAFNPLKDKALCFELMIKYYIRVKQELEDIDEKAGAEYVAYDGLNYITDECPQRAVCLLIVLCNPEERHD
jgi:hypothetical protein